MLLSQSALKTIAATLNSSVSDYGINLKVEEKTHLKEGIEAMLAWCGVIVEETVSFEDLNDTQHSAWIEVAKEYSPVDKMEDEQAMLDTASALFTKYEGNLNPFKQSKLTKHVVDWQVAGDEEVEEILTSPYQLNIDMGNQTGLEVIDMKGEPVMGVLFEINRGTPSLHVEIDGYDTLIHMHRIKGGLVITPDRNSNYFEKPSKEELVYPSRNSTKITN